MRVFLIMETALTGMLTRPIRRLPDHMVLGSHSGE